MRINFKKVIIHNFLSYGHAEIDLNDKNYCLVRGQNLDPLDDATSNGCGKSSWSSAICWCLTGQTTSGVKSGLKNINIDENLCYVTLIFSVDENEFELTRYVEPKSYIKFIVNGVDKSGKGIRETTPTLNEYLTDLVSDGQLLGSVIILGQGLPCKLSANTPSGRKEVLEKLFKSDFMIQDLKRRLETVTNENNAQLREVEDLLLSLDSQEDIYVKQKDDYLKQLEELNKIPDYSVLIEEVNKNIIDTQNLIKEEETKVLEYKTQCVSIGENINKVKDEKQKLLDKEKDDFNGFNTEYLKRKGDLSSNHISKKSELQSKLLLESNNYTSSRQDYITTTSATIMSLNSEIARILSIKDICPTCGQKIPNVNKPDVTPKRLELQKLQEELNAYKSEQTTHLAKLRSDYDANCLAEDSKYNQDVKALDEVYIKNKNQYDITVRSITASFEDQLNDLNKQYQDYASKYNLYERDVKTKEGQLKIYQAQLAQYQAQSANHQANLTRISEALLSIDNKLKDINEKKLYNNNEKSLISEKLSVDSKINTLIKRDFRGFLLSSIIDAVNKKAQDYASYIFNNSEIEFKLDGNNIDITYRNKPFENLSGGEKQKVDLLIQFAIRDVMSDYLQFNSNILVLDEIFDNLDARGCGNVINLISSKFNDVESMFIISHHADELEIPYDSEMVIQKDVNGISKVV